ncbi:hypothetical protein PY650_21565 [Rhizobium calliandrae]|uniref:Uncharacterized protein n=1 Tax=Rhizobium calliandrae TaxID=1312182 RepID=A0ABT7KLP6_9HYPH|nr:hypothetical protein [Rhizobium calliandrae]MDL2408188.1 hypothetical protein [Rhizobium calliandrae]
MKQPAMSEMANIAETVGRLATNGMKPKELIAAVRQEHPNASKKDVSRAAFYAVIIASQQKSERVVDLHNLAVQTRNSPDDARLDDH